MTSPQPDPKLFALDARGRRLKAAEDDVVGICEDVISIALATADSAFSDGSMSPTLALQILSQINSSRRIQTRFRKAVKDGVSAAAEIHGVK